jgi:RNA polymerase sigma-70 factor (ECF subfamily)
MSDEPFVTHRILLFTVACEMLGSAADAEDVVQETCLRWADIGDAARDEVRDPRAYLVRMVTRQALNRLRTLARQREDYVGEWLSEPLLTSPDVAEDVELAESVSIAIAMLTVLETLGPAERAVVLREVFDVPYDQLAEAVGKSSAAVRQIAHRGGRHVAARRPRMEVSRTEQQQVVERFLAALATGDMQGLMDVLAPDVVLVSDSGGLAVPAPGRGHQAGGGAPVRLLAGRAGRGGRHAAAQRRGRGPDRPGRRAQHGGHLRGRRRPDRPHLRDPQPAQAGAAGKGGGAAAVTALRLRHGSRSLGDRPARPGLLPEAARRPGAGTEPGGELHEAHVRAFTLDNIDVL